MQLVELGKGRWTIYAICSGEHTCPLLDFVAELDEKRGMKVLARLRDYFPNSEPKDWVARDLSWKLRGTEEILEYRWPTKGGGTPRVYWFYDEQHVIVCTHGVNKKGDTDEVDIRAADQKRAEYLNAKARGLIEVVPYRSLVEEP